jgi:hypothetical protein
MSKKEKEMAAYAASGMAAVAIYQEIRFKHISISPNENPCGSIRLITRYRDFDLHLNGLLRLPDSKERSLIEKLIMIDFASFFAKRKMIPTFRDALKSSREWGLGIDKAEFILDSQDQIKAYLNYIAISASELIDHPVCAEQINNIAEALKVKGKLGYHEVKAIYHR